MSSRGRTRGRPRRGGNSSESTSGSAMRKLTHEGDGFEAWGGYMQAKMQKLNDQFNMAGGTSGSDIFTGIHVYVNGYTKPSSDELRRLLTSHGGTFEQYLYRTRVTHIVATNLPDSKVKELKGMKVVRPEWITESVTAGKLLPYTNYQLYTAQSRSQHGLTSFTKTSILSRSSSVSSTASAASIGCTKFSNHGNMLNKHDLDPMSDEDSSDEDLANLRTKDIENMHDTSNENSLDNIDEEISGNKTHTSAGKLTGSYHDKFTHTKMARAGESNFLSEFYTHSRLHHISTWGAEYRAYVNELQKQSDGSFPGRQRLQQFHQDSVSRTGGGDFTSGSCSGKPQKIIMHVDMDCFFVSVGLLDKPELRGLPVAVTHSRGKGTAKETPGSDFGFEKKQWELKRQQGGKKGRRSNHISNAGEFADSRLDEEEEEEEGDDNDGKMREIDFLVPKGSTGKETFHSLAEIASCSYEARRAGVKNGMFMGPAKQLCPDLVTIPYNFDKYQEVSRALYDTVASFTHDIEAVSCDEMLVDCTDLLAVTGGTPEEFATLLRKEIYDRTGCTASAGFSRNILLARLATRSAKPNGQFYLTTDAVPEFITKQSIRDLPGVGYSMTKKLNTMSVTTCGDLQKLTLVLLQKEFGPKTGQSLYKNCRGQDDRQVKMEKERKSVSAEINYGIRFQRGSEVEKFLCDLSEEVATRLKNINMRGKTITLKLMIRRGDAPKETAKFMGHGICTNVSKSSSLPMATDDGKVIAKECIAMMRALKAPPADLRGIGIQTHRLENTTLGGCLIGSGNQSILSFAVPRNRSITPSAASPSRVVVPPKQDDHSSGLKQATESINLSDEDMTTYVSDDAEEMDDDGVGDEGNAIVFCSGSLPILEELSRRKTAKRTPPPLPYLPDFGSPGTPVRKQTVESHNEAHDYFPSPSQIDPEVLKELPPDIRAQIEKDMGTKRAQAKVSSVPANQGADEVPGCSHWPSQEAAVTNEDEAPYSPEAGPSTVETEGGSSVEALPSFSQLDMSCLNALPEDLQKEIRDEYLRQGQHSAEPAEDDQPPLMQLQQAKSPAKGRESPRKSPSKSPGRSRKTSPVFKVPKGRAVGRKTKKLSPKKLEFRIQPKITTNYAVRNLAKSLPESPQAMPTPTPTPAPPPTEPDPAVQEEQVNLCGAVSMEEVKHLLVEWLEACPEPQEEDISVMLEYLGQLVLDHNLERVDLVLKFLNRKIRKLANKHWRESFKSILTSTQEVIKSVHGCLLNVDWLLAR
ncbi:DNA repair protein REV1-like [Haliotis rufescens]|uniref:DNA repair protein REV1-like n=1 Tax=Haliotis rufescens TaxID=6454 RepID=UPI00201F285E|nr:DNA repair protein REV1-like [Haliotis rufescens]XP_046370491.2 DNA repair protein REV1-like [Haliotis rufescens]